MAHLDPSLKKSLNNGRSKRFRQKWSDSKFYENMYSKLVSHNKNMANNANAKIKRNTKIRELWKSSPAFVAHVRDGLKLKPNASELYLDGILQLYFKNQWRYTGDFGFWIEGKNPDFVRTDDEKILIEYNGNPFNHTPEKDKLKTAHYIKNGWTVLNLYPDDLKDTNQLISKISNFTNSKIIV